MWQALIKNDKMSLLTQKLNEIGVRNLLLFESKFQTVKASENKQDKLQKISIQSTKQCKRSVPLNVGKIYKFNEMLDVLKNYDYIIFANETEETKKINEISSSEQNRLPRIIESKKNKSSKKSKKNMTLKISVL